jgi:hypothetical protein
LKDPEFLIERTPKGRKTSCSCSISDTELAEPEIIKPTVTVTTTEAITEVDAGDKQLVSVLEQCGECNLHKCEY